MNKEQVYDESIEPLVAQIIAICKENHIAMLATFAIPTDADADLACTSMLPDETGDKPDFIKAAYRALMHGDRKSFAITVTKRQP